MAGIERVEVFRGQRGGWWFRRVSANNRKTGSSECYTRRWSAKRAARRNYPGLPIVVVK